MDGPSTEEGSQLNREHETSAQAPQNPQVIRRSGRVRKPYNRLQQHFSSLEEVSNKPIRAADHPIPSIERPKLVVVLKVKFKFPTPEPNRMAPAAEPKTQIRVPKASATYTPSTQDPELRTDINSRLLADGHITTIQDTLLHALNSNSTNWPTLIQAHALSLLRSGEVSNFESLLQRVIQDVRADTLAARNSTQSNGTSCSKVGKGEGERQSLALPKAVVDEGVKVTRECLEIVCTVEE